MDTSDKTNSSACDYDLDLYTRLMNLNNIEKYKDRYNKILYDSTHNFNNKIKELEIIKSRLRSTLLSFNPEEIKIPLIDTYLDLLIVFLSKDILQNLD